MSLARAIQYVDCELITSLIEAGAITTHGDLINAVRTNTLDVVRCVLSALSNGFINDLDNCGMAALIHACQTRNTDIVRLLCEHGADVNQRSTSGWYPIHFPADALNINILRVLLDYNADVNARDVHGKTALMHVVTNADSYRAIRLLHARGAYIDAQDRNGDTALHWAAYGNRVSNVRELLRLGARYDIPGDMHLTARAMAVERRCHHSVAVIDRRIRAHQYALCFAMYSERFNRRIMDRNVWRVVWSYLTD